MKTHFFFVAGLLTAAVGVLAGCQGTDPTTGSTLVAGQVVENQSRQPVAGATVQVYQSGAGGGYGAVGDPVPADAQGRFSFRFEATGTENYLVRASAPLGYFTDWHSAPRLTAGRKNTDLGVPMYAPAWVRFQLVDVPPRNRVVISINGYEGSGETVFYPRDTVLIRPLLAGFKTALRWSINDQGQNTATNAFVQPSALDTVTVRIPF